MCMSYYVKRMYWKSSNFFLLRWVLLDFFKIKLIFVVNSRERFPVKITPALKDSVYDIKKSSTYITVTLSDSEHKRL